MSPSRRARSQVEPFFFGSPSPTSASTTSPCVHRTTGPGPSRPSSARASSSGGAFGDRLIGLDGHLHPGGERLERLDASDVRARDEPSERVARERSHQRIGLAPAPLVEGADLVVVGPPLAIAGLRMPHQKDERPEGRLERLEDRAVTGVRELPPGGRERHPADLVHLRVRLERTVPDGHRPVANALRPASPVPIPALAELGSEKAVEAGLLGHLAKRALLVRLAGLDLALRQGPVPVAGAMHEENLDLAVGPGPEDRPARRPDLER